ncbi:hypothetical protein CIP107569_02146 [Corynebacterium diphtheriae]|nr:hypothetical protein FRC061569_01910 [Corynebacterium diphtheriae]CAB0526264.1 hypothetical protein FRC020322_02150 [Corynebacterium diphtheriae]CAB0526404.1 hypothetical protein FRC020338_02144 [Corynebacterium diphtheriae]CAB0526821.1 hypothetical protein FRC031641_02148 [Corynebacterium diphtheriae]CAB0568857.1 hypothetical protein CIP107522_02021 [Corynebacterium diphtheriae]
MVMAEYTRLGRNAAGLGASVGQHGSQLSLFINNDASATPITDAMKESFWLPTYQLKPQRLVQTQGLPLPATLPYLAGTNI